MSTWFTLLVIALCLLFFVKAKKTVFRVAICVGLIYVIIQHVLPNFI